MNRNNKFRNRSNDSNSSNNSNINSDSTESFDEIEDVHFNLEVPSMPIPTREEDYQNYLSFCNQPGSTCGDNPLSFEEFCSLNYQDEQGLGYLPQPPRRSISGDDIGKIAAAGLNASLNHFAKQSGGLGRSASTLQSAINAMDSKGVPFIKTVLPKVADALGVSDKGGGGGGSAPSSSFDRASPFDHTKLVLESRPIEEKLSTPIKPNCYYPVYHSASDSFAPLHLTCLSIEFSTDVFNSGDKMYGFLQTSIVSKFLNAAQFAVSFNVSTTLFSLANILLYFNTIAKGLQVYYFYASVIMFTANPDNRNEGMDKLREMMSADDLDYLYQLQSALMKAAIPPRLNELIFYLNQTFSSSSMDGVSLRKIMPFKFNDTTDTYNRFLSFRTDYVKDVLAEFRSTLFMDIDSVMNKVAPNWVQVKMFTPFDKAVHDDQFNTIWANLPTASSATGGSVFLVPSVATDSETILYGAYTDDIDGAAYSMFSAYNTATGRWSPSIWNVVGSRSLYASTRYTSRISYMYSPTAAVSGFFPSNVDVINIYARGETWNLGASTYGFMKSGMIKVLGVSLGSVRETVYKFMEWLISTDTIKERVDKRFGGSSGKGGKTGSSKNKKKGKFKSDDEIES